MSTRPPPRRLSYARFVAPLVLVLFVVGWYRFSVVYIQGANNQLVENGNLAVYVTVQQVQGYLGALLLATYVVAAAGMLAFAYNLLKLRSRR